MKWFYLEADDDTGCDAAAGITARAVTNLHPAIACPAGGAGKSPQTHETCSTA